MLKSFIPFVLVAASSAAAAGQPSERVGFVRVSGGPDLLQLVTTPRTDSKPVAATVAPLSAADAGKGGSPDGFMRCAFWRASGSMECIVEPK